MVGAAPDDGRHLLEGVLEHVVQDEGGPLGRTQTLEEGVHRQRDVVDQRDLVGRIDGTGVERVGGALRDLEGCRSGAAAASAAGRRIDGW